MVVYVIHFLVEYSVVDKDIFHSFEFTDNDMIFSNKITYCYTAIREIIFDCYDTIKIILTS
jgi:hypothetical protein